MARDLVKGNVADVMMQGVVDVLKEEFTHSVGSMVIAENGTLAHALANGLRSEVVEDKL